MVGLRAERILLSSFFKEAKMTFPVNCIELPGPKHAFEMFERLIRHSLRNRGIPESPKNMERALGQILSGSPFVATLKCSIDIRNKGFSELEKEVLRSIGIGFSWPLYRIFETKTISGENLRGRGYECGYWAMWMTKDTCFYVNAPLIKTDLGRLHCRNGPAVSFAGEKHYYWRGVPVPSEYITNEVTVQWIEEVRNAELRRLLIDRFGFERYVREGGFELLQQDDFGKLWYKDARPLPFVFVEVVNSTPESDGTYKRYVIPVRSSVRTAKEAVASSFGLNVESYNPSKES